MATRKSKKSEPQQPDFRNDGITRITVAGFKSIRKKRSIEIRHLTILAGKNSSGKSAMMQPLLLMKQTLDREENVPALWLDGPHVKFSNPNEFLSRNENDNSVRGFSVGVQANGNDEVIMHYDVKGAGLRIKRMDVASQHSSGSLKPGMDSETIATVPQTFENNDYLGDQRVTKRSVVDDAPFLGIEYEFLSSGHEDNFKLFFATEAKKNLTELLHVQGTRGGKDRYFPFALPHRTIDPAEKFLLTYKMRSPVMDYAAGLLYQWSNLSVDSFFSYFHKSVFDRISNRVFKKLMGVIDDLIALELVHELKVKQISANYLELLVSRSSSKGKDLVNIYDVGLGTSHVLPVIVALHAANPGQLVYIEQPEIHLHPQAQVMMATVLANAAKRGVKLVIETHSELLLRGIQTLVAKGDLSPDKTMLHWFSQSEKDGSTTIKSTQLDERGRFGNLPIDFGDVSMHSMDEYLDASLFNKQVNGVNK